MTFHLLGRLALPSRAFAQPLPLPVFASDRAEATARLYRPAAMRARLGCAALPRARSRRARAGAGRVPCSAATRSARKTLSSDWYGTSRRFARAFRSASSGAGSRSEIVMVEGFRFGNAATRPRAQSTYSAVSWLCQNSRSSASLEKAGTGFLSGLFRLRAGILPIEKDLLAFGLRDIVMAPVLLGVPFIPLEPFDVFEEIRELPHARCVASSYTGRNRAGKARAGPGRGARGSRLPPPPV